MSSGNMDTQETENIEAITAELDCKVSEAAAAYFNGVTAQTVNRWIRECKRDYQIEVGYMKAGARWLTPKDIDVLRKHQEDLLGSEKDSQSKSEDSSDRSKDVSEAADQGFNTFSSIAEEADRELSTALAVRDEFVKDRALIIAQEFSPDSIARDIMTQAIGMITKGGDESLGEVAKGGMFRRFQRRDIETQPIRSLSASHSQSALPSGQD